MPATGPVGLPDRRILVRDGYDFTSGIYLACGDLAGIRDDMPLGDARDFLLTELLGDFPFADAGSLAHTVALCLDRFARELIGAVTRLYLIDAPTRGTGKGLLAEVCTWLHRSPGQERAARSEAALSWQLGASSPI
jgi:hypothetical protein